RPGMDYVGSVVFRAENVGSLLRPPSLLAARRAMTAGKLAPPDYKRIEDRAVDEAIELQRGCGLDVLTDGETRRDVFTGSLLDAVEGIAGPPPPPTEWP